MNTEPHQHKTITIAVSTIFQNGGDATRAIEIAKCIRSGKPKDYDLRIVFISRGSRYEETAISYGFEIYKAEPCLKGIRYQDDYKTRFGELIGDKDLAFNILQGEIKAYKEIKPDLLIYGFMPIAGVARRLVEPMLKGIAFLPLPLTEDFLHEPLTFPEELPLSSLPVPFQRFLFSLIPHRIKRINPALRHSFIRKAAEKSGWTGSPLENVFEMLKADLYLINDIPEFYRSGKYRENVIFTGPVYSKPEESEIEDDNILKILSPDNQRKKIFCTLGTSGSKEELFEAIKIFNTDEGMEYSGIILSPKSVCPVDEAKALSANENVYITDKFVPAKKINEKVDLVICHGGQGTLQTAVTSKTPFIGVATQPEQKINLEHLESFGAGIRIKRKEWKCRTILQKVKETFANYTDYKKSVSEVALMYESKDTCKTIQDAVWKMVMED